MLKVAVTVSLALSVTTQVRLLLQLAPVQPAKVEFAPAVAVSVTWDPSGKFALQLVAQLLMPGGLLVTVPLPVPATITLNTDAAWVGVKVAVTFSLAPSVTVQVGLAPLHPPPLHPANDELAAAVAVRVTRVLGSKLALQVCPQLMPEGSLVTLPFPVPLSATVSTGVVLKLAITEMFCIKVTLHTPVPLQPPDQPAKKEFAVGDAVNDTWVPLEKLAVQA